MLVAALALDVAAAAPVQRTAQAPLSLSCPARLPTEQSAAPVAGWTLDRSPKSNGRLSHTSFYAGPVAGDAQLRPTGGGKRGRITTAINDFSAGDAIYFACFYQGTDMVLSKPLPRRIRQCTSVSDEMKPAATDEVITCR